METYESNLNIQLSNTLFQMYDLNNTFILNRKSKNKFGAKNLILTEYIGFLSHYAYSSAKINGFELDFFKIDINKTHQAENTSDGVFLNLTLLSNKPTEFMQKWVQKLICESCTKCTNNIQVFNQLN